MNLFGLKPAASPPPPPAPPAPQPMPASLEAGNFALDLSNLVGQSVISPTPESAVPQAPLPVQAPAVPAVTVAPIAPPVPAPLAVAPPLAPPLAPAPPAVTIAPPIPAPQEPLPIVIGGPLGSVPLAPAPVITIDRSAVPEAAPAPHASEAHISAVSGVTEKIRKSLSENTGAERQALANDALSLDAEINSLEQQEIELHQLLSHLDELKDTLRERRGGLADRIHNMETLDQNVLEELKALES